MKKKEILLISCIVLLAFSMWGFFRISERGNHDILRITVNGEVMGEYPLSKDREIKIGDSNVCQIKDGYAVMIYGNCPDQICVKSHRIGKEGGTIVCLPNKVILETIAAEKPALDSVAS